MPFTRIRIICRHRLLALVLFVSSLIVPVALLAEPRVDKVEVFAPGMNGISRYRIPGVVVTPRGTVLIYCEARKNSSSDWGEIEVHLRRSVDQGQTWQPATLIAHQGSRIEGNPHKKSGGEHDQTVNNPVAIVDQETGAVEFLYCVNYARCFSMRSTDDGLTWSTPIEITATFEPFRQKYDWKVIATGPGHGIQQKNGRLVVPIWLAFGKPGDHGPSAAGTIFSDDHGKTWRAGEIAVPNEGDFNSPNETMLTNRSDGGVMLVSRSLSKPNRKIFATSADGATGWSEPKFHEQLWEPRCMASIIAHPSKPGLQIFSNPHSLAFDAAGKEIPDRAGPRKNLSIKLSRDDGQTWVVNKTLEQGSSAYSDLAILPDGTVICFYEVSDRMAVARFNLEWLTKKD